jgi:hypothetical protein
LTRTAPCPSVEHRTCRSQTRPTYSKTRMHSVRPQLGMSGTYCKSWVTAVPSLGEMGVVEVTVWRLVRDQRGCTINRAHCFKPRNSTSLLHVSDRYCDPYTPVPSRSSRGLATFSISTSSYHLHGSLLLIALVAHSSTMELATTNTCSLQMYLRDDKGSKTTLCLSGSAR